jgi:dUTP pyrophosphatase
LIDSGYRDEIKVLLVNTDPSADYVVEVGDRIAQLVIQRFERIEWNEVSNLDESERSLEGWGSTGR